ncbi:hypothetical protein VAR608DRAFT_4880 [Variovorax sp. HW608]|uniref:hypothetical protein n=1 Tax=Variovorax sp. HW608 TaxID=1034889 RepID=UPI0008201763|nr:hypothetical protein [Variovorax sp. HW608]SCK49090.1 hypothetical protein VAR608DRAFT_4880 [Variovorax sp. HW608]
MATRTKTAAKTQAAGAAAAAAAPVRRNFAIWQFDGLPLPKLGLRMVTKEEGEALIAEGVAVKADGRTKYPFRAGTEPTGFPRPPAPPPAPAAPAAPPVEETDAAPAPAPFEG